jgi:DNA polymerase-1
MNYCSLQDAFGSPGCDSDSGGKEARKEERRKAKILNFSIAYGKTAYGLAKDWGVSLSEAEATVKAWYSDRPEVLAWQLRMREGARRTGKVYTMLGRQRDLPGINVRRTAGHSERAAINTPIQGSAADIVMCAMLGITKNEELRRLGYRMVLQIHDEVVLEGPEGHSEAALARLKAIMERPFDQPLLVDLTVDAKVVKNWGDAK